MVAIFDLIRSLPTSELLKWSILLLIVLLAVFGWIIDMITFENDTIIIGGGGSSSTISKVVSIAPGELPGYTGWGRPENTLAGSFYIKSTSTEFPGIGKEFIITVQCDETRDGSDCAKTEVNSGNSLFFLRAYGPAVISGIVRNSTTHRNDDYSYDVVFVFYDPGLYTIEVVLTFSNPPPLSTFPMQDKNEEPPYEGYLLSGFPLLVTVPEPTIKRKQSQMIHHHEGKKKFTKYNACRIDDLTENSYSSAMEKARWVVTSKINHREYFSKTMKSNVVSKIGYDTNVNSLGINMEYKYNSHCELIPEASVHKDLYDRRVFSQCPTTIHIVYIGDSVLRIQMDTLQTLLDGSASVRFHFLSLHGGYRLNQILGPSNVEDFLRDVQNKAAPNDTTVILFNTGLHDIHRLCGTEFANERMDYLETETLKSGSFTCIDEYRAVLRDFFESIKAFPAQLKVFQSTTAAWPKYGNYGIRWDHQPQRMPLVSDFIALFNEIAFEVLAEHDNTTDDTIEMMDGYWVTYPRPDNREIGDIGKKLSHPGMEVLSVMTRKWAMLILYTVCHQ